MSTLDDDLFALDEQLHRDGYDADGTFRRALHRLQMRRHNDRVAALASQVEEMADSPANTLLARLQAVDGSPTGTMNDFRERLVWREQLNALAPPARRWNLYLRSKEFFFDVRSALPSGLRSQLVATFDTPVSTGKYPTLDHETAEGKPEGFHLYHGEPIADPSQMWASDAAPVTNTVPAAPTDTAEAKE